MMPKMVILLVAATFLVGINADCVPTPIVHTETGDDFYRVLLKDLADAEIQAAAIAKQAQGTGCSTFESLDFFTQLLVTITADNNWLERLRSGAITPSGSECVGINLRINFDLKNTADKATTPIPGPSCDQLTGAALAQYVVQKGGLALKALAAAPDSGGSMTGSYGASTTGSPGKWQKKVQDLNNGLANVRRIAATNDETNCVATTRILADALNWILESAGLTTIIV